MVHDLQAFRIRRLSLQAGQSAASILANGISSRTTRAFMSFGGYLAPSITDNIRRKVACTPCNVFPDLPDMTASMRKSLH